MTANTMTKSPLMIIDVQQGFMTPDTRPVVPRIDALQHRFRQLIVTRFINAPGSGHRKWIHWQRFAADSPEVALAFTPRADADIMDKTIYSAVTPALLDQLRRDKVEAVHLCGIATDNCILKTAVDLFEAGIRPLVHVEACASHGGAEAHRCGLLLLGRMIGRDQLI